MKTTEELRDEFALAALPALIAKDAAHVAHKLLEDGEPPAIWTNDACDVIVTLPPAEACYDISEAWDDVANSAYALADAMLRAKNRKE